MHRVCWNRTILRARRVRLSNKNRGLLCKIVDMYLNHLYFNRCIYLQFYVDSGKTLHHATNDTSRFHQKEKRWRHQSSTLGIKEKWNMEWREQCKWQDKLLFTSEPKYIFIFTTDLEIVVDPQLNFNIQPIFRVC